MLYTGHGFPEGLGQLFGHENADDAVQLVGVAHGLHTGTGFVNPGTIPESGGTVVAGPCVDFAQSVAQLVNRPLAREVDSMSLRLWGYRQEFVDR